MLDLVRGPSRKVHSYETMTCGSLVVSLVGGLSLQRTEEGVSSSGTALVCEMRASLRTYWQVSQSYQRFVYGTGALFLLSGIVHTGAFLVDGGAWEGPLSWRKPISFSFSFAFIAFSLAWVLTFLPKRPLLGWLVMGTFGVSAAVETALIAMQTWRGVASHFNFETDFDTLVFSMMGNMIALVVLSIIGITAWTFASLKAPVSFAWAIKGGLVLMLVGQGLGGLLIREGFLQVEAGPVSSPLLFGAQGVMNVPHAVSLHALQVLPLLAWLAKFTRWEESGRTRVVIAATFGYSGLVFVGVLQALGGNAPLSFTFVVALLFCISAPLLLGALLVTATELVRSRSARNQAPALRGATQD